MRVPLLLLGCVSWVVAEVTLTITASSSTISSVGCTTALAKKSVKPPIPTTSRTSTLSARITLILSASTPTSTITPKDVTSTTTTTAQTTVTTTAAPISNTYSTTSTSTVTTTSTETSTIQSTITETESTTSTSILHVPTAPGFVGVEESSGYTDLNTNNVKKRDADTQMGGALLREFSPVKRTTTQYKYPASVTCIKYVQISYTKKIVAVKPAVTTTAAPRTSTLTSTLTATSTSTVVPPRVTVTSFFSTTTTATVQETTTSTNTFTSTTTITVVVTSTQYDACQPTNVLGPRVQDGRYIQDIQDNENSAVVAAKPAANAEDCCIACIQDSQCQNSQYYGNFGTCYNILSTSPNTCNNPGYAAGQIVLSDVARNGGITISNGNCAIFTA